MDERVKVELPNFLVKYPFLLLFDYEHDILHNCYLNSRYIVMVAKNVVFFGTCSIQLGYPFLPGIFFLFVCSLSILMIDLLTVDKTQKKKNINILV